MAARSNDRPGSGETSPDGLAGESRAERRRRQRLLAATGSPVPAEPSRMDRFRETAKTPAFRWAAAWLALGFLVVLLSQAIPHDYGFLELGWLFTLSVYDLVLAMLGLSVCLAMAETPRRAAAIPVVFVAVLLPMLLFFDAVFGLIRETVLGYSLFLVAPAAVILTGLVLWLPGKWRDGAALVAAAVVAFSMSLFVGLDDLGVGISDFASGALFCSVWLVTAPGLLLRRFKGTWLTIPARILGSWLAVIGVVVGVSLYVPPKRIAPPPPQVGDQNNIRLDDGTVIEIPDPADEEP
ncbi:hypothetical protein M8R20_04400 [Pseudomonas sp. R2.Fl]|nr:hypothetical protein [Pseudomonas sp. R2.Fl]